MLQNIGLAFRCFFAALSGGEDAERLHRALHGIKEPPEIREVIREVAVPLKDAPPPREIVREIPVEVIREVVKEIPVEVIKEVVREVPVEIIKEVIKEVPVVKEIEVIKEVFRDVPRETVKETIREVPKEVVREIVKLVPDTHGPTQLLALLQQDGRLVDFLKEELDNYDDDQVGAAVREIHSKCRKALLKYMPIEPVRPEKEGEVVSLGAGYDPSAIRVTGKVSGDKVPMFGTLRHRGWKAAAVELPTRPAGADPTIIMPAEVEVE